MKVIAVAGARPNFMKIAPLMRVLRQTPGVASLLVHTGQHYDEKMSQLFFDELRIPKPDLNLEVGSGSVCASMARILLAFEPVLQQERPDVVIVVGDVTSTVACAFAAAQMQIPVAHVEAGLRSFDRTMPEEINRILTDSISDFLFVTEPAGLDNLRREGVSDEKIFFVGNVMIDTLLANKSKSDESPVLWQLGLAPREYALLTLHRPSNVDVKEIFLRIFDAVAEVARTMPVVFPVHPRTRKRVGEFGIEERMAALPNLKLIEPLGYLDFLKLTAEAKVVLTDSGGVQEETTILNVPCITLRENTERPVTIAQGTNVLAGTETSKILAATNAVLTGPRRPARQPDLWDGRAAERIVQILAERLRKPSQIRAAA
jgi:UDP-N-acetylglucosamine 2-epimerase (non-hydrolysing)